MQKVSIKVSPEVKDYLARVKSDRKAGHVDAEEYWKGAAAGALIASANPLKWQHGRVRGDESREYYFTNTDQGPRWVVQQRSGMWLVTGPTPRELAKTWGPMTDYAHFTTAEAGKQFVEDGKALDFHPLDRIPGGPRGYDTVPVLDIARRELWKRMLEWDDAPPDSKFFSPSPNNPWVQQYNEVNALLLAERKTNKEYKRAFGVNNPGPFPWLPDAAQKKFMQNPRRLKYRKNVTELLLPGIIGGVAWGAGYGIWRWASGSTFGRKHPLTSGNPRKIRYIESRCRSCGRKVLAMAGEKYPICVTCAKRMRKNPFTDSLVNGLGLGVGFSIAALGAKLLLPQPKDKEQVRA